MTDILLLTPPLLHLNTPYPAMPYLLKYLIAKNHRAKHKDLNIELFLKIFSKRGISEIFEKADSSRFDENSSRVFCLREKYAATIESTVRFLQGKDLSLASRICARTFLPEAERFSAADDDEILMSSFGSCGTHDRAKFYATLYIQDIADFIRKNVDPRFDLNRYANDIVLDTHKFEDIENEIIKSGSSPITSIIKFLLDDAITEAQPKIAAFTAPFPGTFFTSLILMKHIRENHPKIKTVIGGGFINTELRKIEEKNLFKYADFITFDDGEIPLERIINSINGDSSIKLARTFHFENNKIIFNEDTGNCSVKEYLHPDYSGLDLKNYVSLLDTPNPIYRLWNEERWNKLTLAHGCYYAKCSFCDTTVDYVERFDPCSAEIIAERIEQIIKTTGETGFHFTDEAAPINLLKDLSLELLRKNISCSWWTNIRFEKSFSPDLCKLLHAAGCIAVTGGMEGANDRINGILNKGIALEDMIRTLNHFSSAGIWTHAYLIYGVPSQTEQELFDAFETVRQLFFNGLIHSCHWHRFALTYHSGIYNDKEKLGISIVQQNGSFKMNDVTYTEKNGVDFSRYEAGIKTMTRNFLMGSGFDVPVNKWFGDSKKRPITTPDYVEKTLQLKEKTDYTKKLLLTCDIFNKTKDGIFFHTQYNSFTVKLPDKIREWIYSYFRDNLIGYKNDMSLSRFREDFEKGTGSPFEQFNSSKPWKELRENVLLLI